MKMTSKTILGLALLAAFELHAEPTFPEVGATIPGNKFTVGGNCPGGANANPQPAAQTGTHGICEQTVGQNLFQVFLCSAKDCAGNSFTFGHLMYKSGSFDCADALKQCAGFAATAKGGVCTEWELNGGKPAQGRNPAVPPVQPVSGQQCPATPIAKIKKNAGRNVTHVIGTPTCKCPRGTANAGSVSEITVTTAF